MWSCDQGHISNFKGRALNATPCPYPLLSSQASTDKQTQPNAYNQMINTLITVNIYGLACSRDVAGSIFALIRGEQGHWEDTESYPGEWPAAEKRWSGPGRDQL